MDKSDIIRNIYRVPRTFGKLQDGRDLFVYRVLLYCDDFNPRSALFSKGSVGGCYFLPLNFGIRRRRGIASIRTVSLTPPGISTNFILDYIIKDIVKAATEGIPSIDAHGNTVYIFVDVVGFVGDYPESSKVIDVLSHSAGAPCTVCSFRYRNNDNDSKYAYTSMIHSGHSSFVRGMRRSLSLRSIKNHADDFNFLGFKEGGVDNVDDIG